MPAQKAKSPSTQILPRPFLELKELQDSLRMIERGCDYLDSLITDENINDDDNPFPQAVCNYRNSALERFATIRELLKSDAVVLNPEHPAFAEMYNAVCRIAEEAQHRHDDFRIPKAKGETPKPQPARLPLLLVPARPLETPAS